MGGNADNAAAGCFPGNRQRFFQPRDDGNATPLAIQGFAGILSGTVGIDHGGYLEAIASADQAVGHLAVRCFEHAVGKYDGRAFHGGQVP